MFLVFITTAVIILQRELSQYDIKYIGCKICDFRPKLPLSYKWYVTGPWSLWITNMMIWPIMTKSVMVTQVGRRVFLEVSHAPSQGTQPQRPTKFLRPPICMHTVWVLGYSIVWTVTITASEPNNYDDLPRVAFCPWPINRGGASPAFSQITKNAQVWGLQSNHI